MESQFNINQYTNELAMLTFAKRNGKVYTGIKNGKPYRYRKKLTKEDVLKLENEFREKWGKYVKI